jgi:hypothetical protein
MLNGLVGAKFAGSNASVAGISDVIERNQPIGLTDQNLLSRLPEHLLTRLFGGAATVQLKTDEVLFLSAKPAMGATVSRMGCLRSRWCRVRAGNALSSSSAMVRLWPRCRSSTDCHVPPMWWQFSPQS